MLDFPIKVAKVRPTAPLTPLVELRVPFTWTALGGETPVVKVLVSKFQPPKTISASCRVMAFPHT